MRKGAIYKNTRIHVQIIKFKIEGERAVQEGDAHVQRTCWLGVGFIVACVESIGLCSVQSMEIKQLHSIRWMLKEKKNPASHVPTAWRELARVLFFCEAPSSSAAALRTFGAT